MSRSVPADDRLPRGRHVLSAEEVAANQRRRLILATAELVATEGAGRLRGHRIAGRAGVSSSTLYVLFGGADALLAAASEAAASSLLGAVAELRSEPEEVGPAAIVACCCEWASREPALAALLDSGAAIASPAVTAARRRLLERLQIFFDRGYRPGADDGVAIWPLLLTALLDTLARRAARMDPSRARALALEMAGAFDR